MLRIRILNTFKNLNNLKKCSTLLLHYTVSSKMFSPLTEQNVCF